MSVVNSDDDFYGRTERERLESIILGQKGLSVKLPFPNANRFTKKFLKISPLKTESLSTFDSGIVSISNNSLDRITDTNNMYEYFYSYNEPEIIDPDRRFASALSITLQWEKTPSPVIEMSRRVYDATKYRPNQEIKDLPRTEDGSLIIDVHANVDFRKHREYDERMHKELGLQSRRKFRRSNKRPFETPDHEIYRHDVVIEGSNIDYDEEALIKGGDGKSIHKYKSVHELQMERYLKDNCLKMGIHKLRPVQQVMMPIILNSRNDAVVSAPAGYGKTFCYLLPLLIQITDQMSYNLLIGTVKRSPKALVFVGSHTLAFQTCERAMKLAGVGSDKPVIKYVSGAGPKDLQIQDLTSNGCDLLFTTTGRFSDLKRSKHILLSEVHTIVLDEADKVMNQWSTEEINELKARCSPNVRMIVFSTTYTNKTVLLLPESCLKKNYWRIQWGNLNSVNPWVVQEFFDVRKGNSLIELFKQIERKNEKMRYGEITLSTVPKTIVFVNKGEDTILLADLLNIQAHLRGFSWRALPYYSQMPPEALNRTIKAFNSTDQEYSANILVTSDTLNGYDAFNVKLVINFGVPLKTCSYIQRVGRTGRNGHEGNAVTIVHEITNPEVFSDIINTAQECGAIVPHSLNSY
uniref:ATP-dependent RNA helicase n=1 Tax=Panagrolaimus sp. JU765 TaxID=591449 RepID=A0AC34R9R8_9BILA